MSAEAAAPALRARGVRIELTSGTPIVDGFDLDVARGEVVGIVGESGSGKTTLALSLLGFTRPGVRICSGSIEVGGQQIVGRSERDLRKLRGSVVSYVPQEPGASLNPALRIGSSIRDVLEAHRREVESGRVEDAIARFQLPSTPEFVQRYPHQLSGGQQQRVSIAIASVCEPPLVVLDEPTTGLDLVTQAHILAELARLRAELGIAMVYVSHDLAVVSEIADRVVVMYAGRVVEVGPAAGVIGSPRHPYTRALMAAIPDHRRPHRLRGIPGVAAGVGDWPPGCSFAPRCPWEIAACREALPELRELEPAHAARCIRAQEIEAQSDPAVAGDAGCRVPPAAEAEAPLLAVRHLRATHRSDGRTLVVADDVSFEVARGSCVALVGESGSGKTTIARCVAGLHPRSAGEIEFAGAPLDAAASRRPTDVRRRIQIVFQNPYESLNPRHTVADTVARPARMLRSLSAREARGEVDDLLDRVRLPRRLAGRYPGELSGGERQRVAIARALAAHPDLIICDEVTSALDVSVQAAVLDLLLDLMDSMGLSLLFITHDLGVVACVADSVLVLERGVLCEQGTTDAVLNSPTAAYTRGLLDAAPLLRHGGKTPAHP